MKRQDVVWRSSALVRAFLRDIRGGIPFGSEQIEIMLRVLAAGGHPIENFLDVGCGGGALAAAMLRASPTARATLVDFSEPMLAAARASLAARQPAPRFVYADLRQRSWTRAIAGAGPFDAIVSGYAIHHLPDARKRALYGELFRLLAPGGRFINLEHVRSATPWLEQQSDELMVDCLYQFHREQGGAKSRAQVRRQFVRRSDKAANILAPVETQCEWLRKTGYQDVDCYFKVFELAVFGGRRP